MLKKISNELFIDYAGDFIHNLSINGQKILVDDKIFDSRRINIPVQNQQVGPNSIQIRFKAAYHKDGEGLHYYKDPEDQQEYMYTQFEAFNAHKCFPCFD